MYSRGNVVGSGGSADGYDIGAKRQRPLHPTAYLGGASPLQASLFYGGPAFSPAFFAQPRPFPVVRLRGLPYDCTESDVYTFFAGLDVVDVLLVNKQGRFSGEAYCVFGAPLQIDFALQKNRQNMGRRYIEVFRSKKSEYYEAVAAEVSEGKTFSKEYAPVAGAPPSKSSSDKGHLEHTGVLKLRGLPFSASKQDVIDFFKEYNLTEENVHILVHSDGRATGEAYVEFLCPAESRVAMSKDKMLLGSRYIELFPSSRDEAVRAAAKSR